MDRDSTAWRKEGNQTFTSFNTEIHGAGCGLDRVWIRVWIGLRLELDPLFWSFLCMLHLGCSVTRKGRQGVQLDCLKAWQRGFTTVCCLHGRVNNCRHQLAHIFYHSKGLDQRSGSTPVERSGSGVWIRGLDRLWDRGLIQTLHFEPQPYHHIPFKFGHVLVQVLNLLVDPKRASKICFSAAFAFTCRCRAS